MDNQVEWKLLVGYKTRPRIGVLLEDLPGRGAICKRGVWFGTARRPARVGHSWHQNVAQGRPLITTPNNIMGFHKSTIGNKCKQNSPRKKSNLSKRRQILTLLRIIFHVADKKELTSSPKCYRTSSKYKAWKTKHGKNCKMYPSQVIFSYFYSSNMSMTHGSWRRVQSKKIPKIFFRILQDDSKTVSVKIGSRVPKKLGPFFSLFLMRKPLSSGQKWLLRPYLPLILCCGLIISTWDWELLESLLKAQRSQGLVPSPK